MTSIYPPEVAQFIDKHWGSVSHRRMFAIGQVNVKVHGMFQLTPDTDPPDEACICAALWLQGLESGDAAEYAKCDTQAMRVYKSWLKNREMH